MLKPGGYGVITSPEGVKEVDSFVCKHCQKIVEVQPFMDPTLFGGFCKCCMGLICPQCYDAVMKGEPCKPWEKRLDEYEARQRFLASVGLE